MKGGLGMKFRLLEDARRRESGPGWGLEGGVAGTWVTFQSECVRGL